MRKTEYRPVVKIENGIVSICRKRHCENTYLQFCQCVNWDSNKKVLSPRDSDVCYIKLSADVREKIKGNYCVVVNLDTGEFADVFIDPDVLKDTMGEIRVTNYVKKTVGITEKSNIAVCIENSAEFSTVLVQKMENIKSDVVVIPEGVISEEILRSFSFFEVINNLTKDSIFVKSKNIVTEKTKNLREIRLNRKQRKLLSDNIPSRLTKEQWAQLLDTKDVTPEEKEIFKNEYSEDSNGYTIKESIEDMSYTANQIIKKFINVNFGESIVLRPVIETYRYKERRGLLKVLSDFYVGRSTLTLNCRRPHECDENADIVRMTEDNMRFLGIEAMDKVVLRFKNKKISCHVLPFSEDKYTNTNIPSVIELSVGIPAHIRDTLGVTDIQSSVKVDRDTGFIFRKSFNEQLVPILLALFSINIFDGLKRWVSLLICAGLIPVIMYVTLSPKRNMRGK